MLKAGLTMAVVAVGMTMSVTASAETLVQRGQYLAHIMDCGGCHNTGAFTPKPKLDTPLAGSDIGFEVPGLGIFYPPNLTPDAETGLGKWSDEEIVTAFTKGERPDGRVLAPSMPWMSYSHINGKDAKALVAYLRSLPSVSHRVPGPFGPSEKPASPYMKIATPE